MITNALILKNLDINNTHFIQLPIKNNKIIQFIVDTEKDSLIVVMYDSA